MKWVANAIITLGAISLLAAGICLTVEDRTGSAATALSFGFLLVVMLLLAKFRRFKGFGFEAEMWEEKQAEAENLIERLKAISKAMVQQMAAYSANMGLVNLGATITVPHFEENLAHLRAILRQVEPDTTDDAKLLDPLLKRIMRACCSQAAQLVGRALTDELLRLNTAPAESADQTEIWTKRIGQIKDLQQANLLQQTWTSEPDYINNLIRQTEDAPLPKEELVKLLHRLRLMEDELRYFTFHHTFRRTRKDDEYPWK